MARITITPEEFAEKHARRLKGAVEDIRAGVERVTVAPTMLAAAKQDKMIARLQESVSSGKWAARLKAVTLDEWKSKTLEKGLGRIAAGIDAAHDKQVRFATALLGYEGNLLTTLDKMPDLTLEDSVSRATAWIRGMAKFKMT
jgi:hypothetical protein